MKARTLVLCAVLGGCTFQPQIYANTPAMVSVCVQNNGNWTDAVSAAQQSCQLEAKNASFIGNSSGCHPDFMGMPMGRLANFHCE